MFVEWLFKEAYYLRMFMQLSNIPHYATLQKFAARVSGTIYIGEDNFFIRSIIIWQYQEVIHWHHRIIRIQTN